MIRCVDITHRFHDANALNGISFNVNKGELFGVVGPDGAGKSTLMRILATTLEPTGGKLFMNGVPVSRSLFTQREKIAYMPQRFGLYEDLTVQENIFFFGRIYGVSNADIKKRISRLYRFSRLEPFKDRRAGKLSGGMKQKLGLACSLIHVPELLILDEPTNGVDPVSRREFWSILYELLADGVTIIVSTAYLDEAERCSRIALIENGRFIALNDPETIRRSFKEQFFIMSNTDPEHAESAVKKSGAAGRVSRIGNTIRFFASTKKKSPTIADQLRKAGISGSFKKAEPTLEDCFLELTKDSHMRRTK